LRGLVRPLGQIEEANLVVEAEMVGDRHHLEGARARRKDVKLDGHDVLLVMWNSGLSGAACLRRSARRLGLPLEMFQQARPAAVHVLAHGGARFRAQPLELAMFQLYEGGIRSLRDEPDL